MSIAQSSYSPVKLKVYIGLYVTYIFKWLISQKEICLTKVPFLRYCHIYCTSYFYLGCQKNYDPCMDSAVFGEKK